MARWHSFLAVAVVGLTFLLPGRAGAQKAIMAKAPAGDRVASATGKVIEVFEQKSNKLAWRVKWLDQSDIQVLLYAADGKTLASGDKGGHVNMHDAATGAFVWLAEKKDKQGRSYQGVNVLGFSPNGKLLGSAHADGLVNVRHAVNGKLMWSANTQLQDVYGLEFSKDGKKVSVKASRGKSQTFEVATGKRLEGSEGR